MIGLRESLRQLKYKIERQIIPRLCLHWNESKLVCAQLSLDCPYTGLTHAYLDLQYQYCIETRFQGVLALICTRPDAVNEDQTQVYPHASNNIICKKEKIRI